MLRRRLDQGEAVVTISCNFSRLHFIKPDFAQRFEDVLNEYQIPKELVEVEITETMVVEEMEAKTAEQTLEDLHGRGIRLSIDDFGSGYSSLGVIEKIPASVIKLDRSFLLNQEDRDRQVKIMKSIVDLAGNLGAQIVCEGVETDADVCGKSAPVWHKATATPDLYRKQNLKTGCPMKSNNTNLKEKDGSLRETAVLLFKFYAVLACSLPELLESSFPFTSAFAFSGFFHACMARARAITP